MVPVHTLSKAQFRVKYHFEISRRGIFTAGDLLQGEVVVGDRIYADPFPTGVTIAAVEFVDHISERRFDIALAFVEKPPKSTLEAAFPAGAVLSITAA